MEDARQKSKMGKGEKIAYGIGATTLGAAAYTGITGTHAAERKIMKNARDLMTSGVHRDIVNALEKKQRSRWNMKYHAKLPLTAAGINAMAIGYGLTRMRKPKVNDTV